jgi:putative beta barrel porin BBP7
MPLRMTVALCVICVFLPPNYGQEPLANSSATSQPFHKRSTTSPASDFVEEMISSAPDDSFWFTGEYLFGWIRGTNLPPLVTTSSAGTAQADAGILGRATTSILFGGKVNDEVRSGLRLGTGYVYDQEHGLGFEAGFTYLASQTSDFSASSNDFPILARPYNDANAATPATTPQAVLIAFPGQSTGTVDVEAESGNFYEAHLDWTENIVDTGWMSIGCLMGYRFSRYDDALGIRQFITPSVGTQIATVDEFGAQNQFHGLDLGLQAQLSWKNLSLNLLGKVAPGSIFREVNINGSQVVTATGSAPVNSTGGVYALSSNIGNHSSNNLSLFSEVGGTLNWRVRSNVRVHLGYSAMFLNDVARSHNQIDFTVNPNLFPPATTGGPNRPSFQLHHTDVWLQSINIGADFFF